MELTPMYRCVAAVGVHQAKLTVCVIYEDENGEVHVELREFGGFKRDRRTMAQWMGSFCPELDGDLTEEHRFVLSELMAHIEMLEKRIATFQRQLLRGLAPQQAFCAPSRPFRVWMNPVPRCCWSRSVRI